MYKVTGIRSWNMNADAMDELVRFYGDLLGAEVRETQSLDGQPVVRMNVAGCGIGVFDSSQGPRSGVPHHTFSVEGPDDSAEMVKEIEAKGYVVDRIRPHNDGRGYSIYVIDPSGNRIELSSDPV
jgi:predicted enzyme related to lactoylglutathione lyase